MLSRSTPATPAPITISQSLFHGRAGWTRPSRIGSKALESYGTYGEVHRNLARALIVQEKFDEAISHGQQAVQINPADFEARDHLGVALLRRGRPDEALRPIPQSRGGPARTISTPTTIPAWRG